MQKTKWFTLSKANGLKLVLIIFLASVMVGSGNLCNKKKKKDTDTGSSVPFTQVFETISKPNQPTGQTYGGSIGVSYNYSASGALSNFGHSVEYRFDWGDGSLSNWLTSTRASKSWFLDNTYVVRTQARCATHTLIVSDWSIGLSVNISTSPGSWVCFTLDSTSADGYPSPIPVYPYDTSIAIDSNDKIHISYVFVYPNFYLKYATNATGSWGYTTLDSTGNGRFASIAIDFNNNVHISYYYWPYEDLKYATNATGFWVYTILDSVGYGGSDISIAVTGTTSTQVHISYCDVTYGNLKYATNATGSWIATTLDSIGVVGAYASIALDSNNKVHISYYDYTNGDLKYATNATGSWVYATLDSEGDVGYDTSIALDSNNKVHISYYDYTNGALKYVTNTTGSWIYTILDSSGDVGWYTSIALDSNNKVHISYYDYTNGDLKYATNATGSWVYTSLDSGLYTSTSIAIDSYNKVHISYYDYTNSALKYATNSNQ